MKKIFLASSSLRRRELLAKCGVDFTCIPADIDETINEENDLEKEIQRLSLRKAEAVFACHPDGIVIGSDTIVTKDHKILGKPHSEKQAENMLKLLSGGMHHVITGLAVISTQRQYVDDTISCVTFAELSDLEIKSYIASGEPMDKAGAYGIQGLAGRFITHIDGDFYAIMGLPLNKVYEELKYYGY